MKKQKIKILSLSKKTISRFNEKNQIVGGTGNTISIFIVCMEGFTDGCSPSFLGQCPTNGLECDTNITACQ